MQVLIKTSFYRGTAGLFIPVRSRKARRLLFFPFCLGFRVSGFGFRVSGFGFRVQGLYLRCCEARCFLFLLAVFFKDIEVLLLHERLTFIYI
jgi:hypothetical protein